MHPGRDVSLRYWTDFTNVQYSVSPRAFPKRLMQRIVPFVLLIVTSDFFNVYSSQLLYV